MICWKLKRIWFKTYSGFIPQGLFFSRMAGCFGVGQRYYGNRAWKVSVTQRGFRKVVAEDSTDESDSSLWNVTSLPVVRRSFFFVFLLNTPCQKLEKPFEGTICDVSILCRKLWQMSFSVYKRKGRSFFLSWQRIVLIPRRLIRQFQEYKNKNQTETINTLKSSICA